MTQLPPHKVCFRCPGSKAKLAPWIIEEFPRTGFDKYLELFAGRGNVFFRLRLSEGFNFQTYQLNDIATKDFFEAILKVWPEKFLRIKNHPCYWGDEIKRRALQRSYLHMILFAVYSYGGYSPYKEGSSIGLFSGGWDGRNAKSLETLYRLVCRCKELLQDVELTSLDAIDLLRSIKNNADYFVYLDPPYRKINAGYGSYLDSWYVKLYSLLRDAKFKWVLSEYKNKLITKMLGQPIKVKQVTTSHNHRKRRIECLWSNQ